MALAQVAPIRARAPAVKNGRGAFFPDLLVAALQRAIALAEMDGAAAAVAKHLDFDVARLLQVFFQIDRGIAERRFGLVGRGRQREREFVGGLRHLHAAAAAAGGRLHQHRKADGFGDGHGVVVGADRAVGAGHHGNAEPFRGFLASILSPIRRICSAFGPMKCRL